MKFTSYKSLEKYLRSKTDNDFFISCTKSNKVSIVIAVDNELKVLDTEIGYWNWATEKWANEILKFIDRKKYDKEYI